MAEKQSPAASTGSSANGSGGTPQSRHSPISRLVVTKQPPTHIFANEWFEIEFDIDLVKGKGSFDGAEFVASLHHHKSKRIVSEDDVAFTVVPSAPLKFSSQETSPKRKRSLRCKISPKQVRRDKANAYFIQLAPREGSGPLDIMPATSGKVSVVNYKINISVTDEWEPIWYKDEGGRDKCMTIEAVLLNREGTLSVGSAVPLQMTLFYDHADQPVKVGRQNIFRVMGPLITKTDVQSGGATLKFRIDDVSKNHQGQDFRVEVAPDPKAKGFMDVAPGFSPAVSIRSKRNKRQRLGSLSRAEQSRYTSSPAAAAYQQPRVPSMPLDDRRPEAPFAGVDTARLREAMKGVAAWTEEVVSGLYPLQWQVIGYASNPDGSPDYSRPYHTMPNPNERIARVLSMYNDVTREHLRFLISSVEGAEPSRRGPLVALPQAAPRIPDDAMAMTGPGLFPFPIDPRLGHPGLPPHPSMGQQGSFLPPGHPMSMPPDVFRNKGEAGFPLQAAGPSQTPMQRQNPSGHPGSMMRMGEMGGIPMSGHAASMPVQSVRNVQTESLEETTSRSQSFDEENRETEVAYILAKQYNATRTGEKLGYPAFSESKELLGFYHESSKRVGVDRFIPISQHRDDFGPLEMVHASQILSNAIESKDKAVHALKDWGSIENLIDHVLVYEWSKGLGTGNSGEDAAA